MKTHENEKISLEKGKRKISSFIAEGLLYEFNLDFLDNDRTIAVKEALKKDPLLKLQLNKIEKAESYLRDLSQIMVSAEALTRVNVRLNPWVKLMREFHLSKWPKELVRTVEVAITLLILGLVFISLPWNKIKNSFSSADKHYVLVEVKGPENIQNNLENKTQDEMQFDDEAIKKTSKKDSPLIIAPKMTSNEEAKILESQKSGTTDIQNPEIPIKETGYLYRGFVKIKSLDANNAKLVQQIMQMGAQKAGKVELGWRKDHGSYFHFTVPEAQYEKVKDIFNGFGKLIIKREKHYKIMPEGIIRIIIDAQDDPLIIKPSNSQSMTDKNISNHDEN